jgi:hypothetical protein
MKKIIVALGALAVVASLSSSPAGAGDVVRLAGAGVAVTGDPVPGSTLTAEPAAWSAQPDERRYEWLRDGEDAVVSRDRSYTLVPADIGHTLVVVERVAVGSQLDETSSASPVVKAAPGAAAAPAPAAGPAAAPAPAVVLTPAVNVTRPTITGRASVGRRLRLASKGTWNAAGHSYRYQWLRNGKAVRGASKTSYRLTKKDRRQRISVRVTARRSGYPIVSATSVRTSRIR